MTEVFHHHHHHKKIEKHVHKEKWINVIDDFVYFFSTISILMTLPQIFKIWVEHNASGVSGISWIAYLFGACFWTLYGIAHKDKLIITINTIWIFLNLSIVTGIFMFGGSF